MKIVEGQRNGGDNECFFFFQAEDGIRDLTVTGVQTCALPIYGRQRSFRRGPAAVQPAGVRPSDKSYKSPAPHLYPDGARVSCDQFGPGEESQIGRASCRERV